MEISKGAWHYRFLKFCSYYPEANLCPYVRQVIGAMMVCVGMTLVVLMMAIALSYPIWRWWSTNGLVGFLSGCIWIVVGVFAVKTYREEWEQDYRTLRRWKSFPAQWEDEMSSVTIDVRKWYHRDQWRPVKVQSPKKPNIFVEYVRAAHNKVCPGIRFK